MRTSTILVLLGASLILGEVSFPIIISFPLNILPYISALVIGFTSCILALFSLTLYEEGKAKLNVVRAVLAFSALLALLSGGGFIVGSACLLLSSFILGGKYDREFG